MRTRNVYSVATHAKTPRKARQSFRNLANARGWKCKTHIVGVKREKHGFYRVEFIRKRKR